MSEKYDNKGELKSNDKYNNKEREITSTMDRGVHAENYNEYQNQSGEWNIKIDIGFYLAISLLFSIIIYKRTQL